MGTAKIEVVFRHVGEHLTIDLMQPRPDVSAQGSEPQPPAPNGHGASASPAASSSPA